MLALAKVAVTQSHRGGLRAIADLTQTLPGTLSLDQGGVQYGLPPGAMESLRELVGPNFAGIAVAGPYQSICD